MKLDKGNNSFYGLFHQKLLWRGPIFVGEEKKDYFYGFIILKLMEKQKIIFEYCKLIHFRPPRRWGDVWKTELNPSVLLVVASKPVLSRIKNILFANERKKKIVSSLNFPQMVINN